MDTLDTQTLDILAGLVILALIAIAAWFVYRKRQTERLQERFGPEYGRAVERLGQAKAEAELRARERRVEKLAIVPLPAAEATRFREAWKALQARFVDNPKGVLADADKLVRELMLKRGYPMGDFEHRAADISVDHPAVVDHYRAAQAIALRDQRGEADTEDMRKAVVHYRALFQELLEVDEARPMPAKPMEARS